MQAGKGVPSERHVRLRYTRSLKRRQTLRSRACFSFATDLSQKSKKPRIGLLGSGYETSAPRLGDFD